MKKKRIDESQTFCNGSTTTKRKSAEIEEETPEKAIRFEQEVDRKLDCWLSKFNMCDKIEEHWISGLKSSLVPVPNRHDELCFSKKKLMKLMIGMMCEGKFLEIGRANQFQILLKLLNSPDQDMKLLGCLLVAQQINSVSEELLRLSIPCLIQLLNSELFPIHREIVASLVKWLSKRGEDLRLRLGRAGVFTGLLVFVSQEEEKVQILALKAIKDLIFLTKSNQELLALAGGVQLFFDHLRSSSENAKCLIIEILGMLASLPDVRREIGSRTGIVALIEVARTGSMAAKARAAHTLGFLAFTKRLRRRIVDAGGISVFVELLRNGDEAAKRIAGNSLGIISACFDHLSPVAQAGAIPHFIELLEGNDPHGKDIAEDAFCILAVSEENALAIVDHLVRILQHGQLESKTAAADVLWDLASYRHTISIAMASGAIPVLIELLKNENDELRESVSGAVAQLTYNDDDRDFLADSGAIPILVELLQDRSTEVKGNVTEALHNFAEVPSYRSYIIDTCGLPNFVDILGA